MHRKRRTSLRRAMRASGAVRSSKVERRESMRQRRTQLALQHLEGSLLLANLEQLHCPLLVRRIASNLTHNLPHKRHALVQFLRHRQASAVKFCDSRLSICLSRGSLSLGPSLSVGTRPRRLALSLGGGKDGVAARVEEREGWTRYE